MPLFVYFLFVIIYGGANGYASLFDPTSFIGLIHILLLITFGGVLLFLLFLCRGPTEEEEKRYQEIQEQGKRLKETYQKTVSYKDYKAWLDWCDRYNGGKRN